ncbi:UDP-N-acetylmuramoyl-L-alanyl-D-glutamate--2,6-diaminopimelate ligase [[Limnothrix rosea] IAM M-220]|uniref:UDP-N-acetylmuramoyl-L-alanyl-D-glutamate--2, 6-diaminopimelate ligase n=1 Tax=[Limnothrix rosea] IAM M-220 TaxID=454133 RepID=UPI0009619415|nr:UDP-N-acetylmuramoyl-L-alanyl-D-glutamate--2,6-diaminopimelate ligase [[Limnothrix rosea] IAM M-220]OKH17617.1 UDP-N-acetylmuramoyl-L-alanyl-D-glutamate--2,6-diaminopimelate ligase [[Limnothrix rosea] IAM M-220]
MQLGELLGQVSVIDALPDHPVLTQEIKGLTTNSQGVVTGDLFIGLPGARVDGGEFWQGALDSGAIAAVISAEAVEKFPAKNGECVIVTSDPIIACAEIANLFYKFPTQSLKLAGVTGTNGKTTISHLIEFFLQQAKKPTALIGTLYTRWEGYEKIATHTTPFAVDLQKNFAKAVKAGNTHGVMEVSSHALDQKRVKGCEFDVSVFTNLTQDHLDYHKTMEAYFQAKALLFSDEYCKGRAIINIDDQYGARLAHKLGDKCWGYSLQDQDAAIFMDRLEYTATGVTGRLRTPEGTAQFSSPLVGQFNLENVMAAVGAGLALGLDLEKMLEVLPKFMGVPGRMERVQISEEQDISVIVDYAHTPDSLENLLKASRPFIPRKMICVFGCGGDRDRTKRPLMGKIAATKSDWAVVTSDNPRTEDPKQILADVVEGIPEAIQFLVIPDRAAAIHQAILEAQPGDGVLIAGKGHEDYQILGTEKIHFDDREEARKALGDRLKTA